MLLSSMWYQSASPKNSSLGTGQEPEGRSEHMVVSTESSGCILRHIQPLIFTFGFRSDKIQVLFHIKYNAKLIAKQFCGGLK